MFVGVLESVCTPTTYSTLATGMCPNSRKARLCSSVQLRYILWTQEKHQHQRRQQHHSHVLTCNLHSHTHTLTGVNVGVWEVWSACSPMPWHPNQQHLLLSYHKNESALPPLCAFMLLCASKDWGRVTTANIYFNNTHACNNSWRLTLAKITQLLLCTAFSRGSYLHNS